MTKTERALYEVSRGAVRGFVQQVLKRVPSSIPQGVAVAWLSNEEDRYAISLRRDSEPEEKAKAAPTRRSRKEK